MMAGLTDTQMDGQGNYYKASADFVWWALTNALTYFAKNPD